MGEYRLRIKSEGIRTTQGALDSINRRLEKITIAATQAATAMTAALRAANVQAQALNANLTVAKTQRAEEAKVRAAKQTTDKLKIEYQKRADAEWRELQRTAARWEREEAKRAKAAQRPKAGSRASSGSGMSVGLPGVSSIASWGMGMGAGAIMSAAALTAYEGKQNMMLDEKLMALARQGRGVGQAQVPLATLRQMTFGAAKNYGVDADSVAGGMAAIVSKTGNMSLAMNSAEVLAKMSVATGASMEDLGGVIADLATKFDTTDPQALNDALSNLAMQGKNGAFELKDMAGELPEMAAAARAFGYSGKQGVISLGGAAQVLRGSISSAAETSTAYKRFLQETSINRIKLNSHGVKTQDDKGNNLDFGTIMANVVAASNGGDAAKLKSMGYDVKSIGAVNAYSTVYQNAIAKGASKDEARSAVIRAQQEAESATKARAEIDRDAAEATQSASAKFRSSMAAVQEAFGRVNWDPLIDSIPILTESLIDLSSVVVAMFQLLSTIPGIREMAEAEKTRVVSTNEGKKLNELRAQRNEAEQSIGSLNDVINNPATKNKDRKEAIAKRDKLIADRQKIKGQISTQEKTSQAASDVAHQASQTAITASNKEVKNIEHQAMLGAAIPVFGPLINAFGLLTRAAENASTKLDTVKPKDSTE